eukprot:365461-Chlamydomonas_euryale.AAC.4
MCRQQRRRPVGMSLWSAFRSPTAMTKQQTTTRRTREHKPAVSPRQDGGGRGGGGVEEDIRRNVWPPALARWEEDVTGHPPGPCQHEVRGGGSLRSSSSSSERSFTREEGAQC